MRHASRLLAGLLIAVCLNGAGVLAQETSALVIGESVTGTVEQGQPVTFTLELPLTQDVILALEADAVVLAPYSVTTSTPEETVTERVEQGGGGGDGAVATHQLIPAYILPDDETEPPADVSRAVEVTLTRPLNGTANFTLTAYAIDPLRIDPAASEPLEIEPTENVPFQVMLIDAPFDQPFAVQIEDLDEDGMFLWAAYVPEMTQAFDPLSESDTPLPTPVILDKGFVQDAVEGLQELEIYYSGQSTFRVVVESDSPYTLRYQPLEYQPLAEAETQSLTLSYQRPVQLLRFNANEGDMISFTAILDGQGAFVSLFQGEAGATGTSINLGESVTRETSFPTATTVIVPITATGPVTVFVRIPLVFSRDTVTVELGWSP